ncbi:MAG TPA: hypothetical protein VHG91_18560 [Longimicrobium sp.]|nr:hypothetical protein [Longimicrobium sp.]
MGIQSDYLLRLIEQAMRVLLRLAKIGRVDDALHELDEATAALLGELTDIVPRLDAATAAHLLGDADRVVAWALLLTKRAEVERLRGDEAAAAALERRAADIVLEVRPRVLRLGAEADGVLGAVVSHGAERSEVIEPGTTA